MNTTAITWEDIVAAAKHLDIEPCAMQAVYKVESAGAAFLPSGKVKILFEGHIFWKQLQKHGINPDYHAAEHPSVLYPKWTKTHYKGGEKEYDRLNEAIGIHEEAALASASWGAFQIMGFNYASCGYRTVFDFVEAQKTSAASQLNAFCTFIEQMGLVQHLKNKNWAAFAKGYNGPGYAANKYDELLEKAYVTCLNG